MKGRKRIQRREPRWEEIEALMKGGVHCYSWFKRSQKLWEERMRDYWKLEDELVEKMGRKVTGFHFSYDGAVLSVDGDTFPIKDFLKGLGFRWQPVEKEWYIRIEPDIEKILKIKDAIIRKYQEVKDED